MRLRIKYIKINSILFLFFIMRKNYVLVVFLNYYYYFALRGIGEAGRRRKKIRKKIIN